MRHKSKNRKDHKPTENTRSFANKGDKYGRPEN